MITVVVAEHGRIERGAPSGPSAWGVALDARLYDRLRHADRWRQDVGKAIFDWRDGFARATQWVGVMQVPGLQVEILPKIDAFSAAENEDNEARGQARQNLLYMLSVAGDLPVRSRDMAELIARRAPLSETLAALFAHRLREELLRGAERAYVGQEENLRGFKGKMVLAAQLRHNAGHRERFYCRFDEFLTDTPLNRVFKAACRLLLGVTRLPGTQDALRQCVLLLDDVADAVMTPSDLARVTIHRQNARFDDVFRFCRLLFAGLSPTPESGKEHSFSLLFDMNQVFERFVAAFLQRFVAPRLGDVRVLPQAERHKRHLMECQGRGVLLLRPDVLIEGFGALLGRQLVLDTKWKRLTAGKHRDGVSEADLYQMHAYTRRYGCTRSVLLYPHGPGLEPRDFDVLDATGAQSLERVAIRQVNLHRNLGLEQEREALADELANIVRQGLVAPPEPSYGGEASATSPG